MVCGVTGAIYCYYLSNCLANWCSKIPTCLSSVPCLFPLHIVYMLVVSQLSCVCPSGVPGSSCVALLWHVLLAHVIGPSSLSKSLTSKFLYCEVLQILRCGAQLHAQHRR